jgi:hypothetical protein
LSDQGYDIISGAPPATGDKSINKEYDHRVDHTTKEACAFSGFIPSDSLTKVGSDERADNAPVANRFA